MRDPRDVPSFPPYDLLDHYVSSGTEKMRKLERLYYQTQAHAWDPRAVLDELEARHGGVHLAEGKREAVGQLFSVLLWGELAAWKGKALVVEVGVASPVDHDLVPRVPFLSEAAQVGVGHQLPAGLHAQ